ncbi:MAG: FecR domain-containing protein [bacterium]
MTKKYLIIGLGLVLLVVGGFSMRGGNTSTIATTTPPVVKKEAEVISPIAKGGWIEVLSGKAFLIVSKDGIEAKNELSTGDSVGEGSVISTNETGKSSIHLFDGSVLRISPSTRFTIKSAEYNKDSGKLILEASLSIGKIWSKIIELATPDSIWKVETSNTVATVRGSAFGVSSDGKKSEIYGSQHKIAVDVIDPKTKEKIKTQSIIVEEGKILRVADTDIDKIKKLETQAASASPAQKDSILKTVELSFVPEKITEKIKKDEWFSGNEGDDKKIEDKIKEIKDKVNGDKMDFKRELNRESEDVLNGIRAKKQENQQNSKDDKTPDGKEVNSKVEDKIKTPEDIKKTDELKKVNENNIETSENWDSMKIETLGQLNSVSEGEMFTLHATLYDKKGTTKDITKEAVWSVIGPIGKVTRPGSFAAKLDDSVSEVGEGNGFIIATWEDKNGKKMLGKSDPVRVILKIDESINEDNFIGQ